MATTLRIFDVPASTPEQPKPKPVERAAPEVLSETGDAARAAAMKNLKEMGLLVRSVNWAPTPNGTPELVAYVSRRA